ncbi:PD-(D/E)XK nuclease-like domain-containing protein [Rhodococcus koreensis]
MSDDTEYQGVIPDLDENVYHGLKDILSSSGARNILPPSCPAQFKWSLDNRTEKKEYDLGHYAHKLVLGVGSEIVEVTEKTWGTNAAKAAKAKAYAEGKVPLLTKDKLMVEDMAAAIDNTPKAREYLSDGMVEHSLFWEDPSGARLRARPDFARPDWSTLVDYKTSTTAEPDAFQKAVLNYGYHMQDDFYRQGVITLDLHPNPDFVFVVQCKTPPYPVSVIRLDDVTRAVGYHMNRRAIELFASCQRMNHWPGWGNRVHTVGLSGWALKQQEDMLELLAAREQVSF